MIRAALFYSSGTMGVWNRFIMMQGNFISMSTMVTLDQDYLCFLSVFQIFSISVINFGH
jgi:hypothetical protein